MYTNATAVETAYFLAYFLAGVSGILILSLSRTWVDAVAAISLFVIGYIIGQLLASASRNGAVSLLLALLPF